MSTLHVLSHSPFADNRLPSCLRLLGSNDGLLLCGDAVYALCEATAPLRALKDRIGTFELFVLNEDAHARNVQMPHWVTCIDYAGFVQLSIRYAKVNTWL